MRKLILSISLALLTTGQKLCNAYGEPSKKSIAVHLEKSSGFLFCKTDQASIAFLAFLDSCTSWHLSCCPRGKRTGLVRFWRFAIARHTNSSSRTVSVRHCSYLAVPTFRIPYIKKFN